MAVEKIENLLKMYRADAVTDYVVEKELSKFMGDLVRVKISHNGNGGKTKSFCFFFMPQKQVEGFKVLLFIDDAAINFYYDEEEMAIVLIRLKERIQKILTSYNKFLLDTGDREITAQYALGFLLNLYSSYKSDLVVSRPDFLPADEEILKYSDVFSLEKAEKDDFEAIKIGGFVCDDILSELKAYISNRADITIKIVDDPKETPTMNLYHQELIDNCNSTLGGTRDHKEIPADYKPPYNQ